MDSRYCSCLIICIRIQFIVIKIDTESSSEIKCFHVEIIEHFDDLGYQKYIFKDLDSRFPVFYMGTLLPNWNQKLMKIGDKGYVRIKRKQAGIDTWYNKDEDTYVKYKYDGVYIDTFIHERPQDTDEIIIL